MQCVVRIVLDEVARYSFLVGLLHSLLHAGLSRRTALAIWHQPKNAPTQMAVSQYLHPTPQSNSHETDRK